MGPRPPVAHKKTVHLSDRNRPSAPTLAPEETGLAVPPGPKRSTGGSAGLRRPLLGFKGRQPRNPVPTLPQRPTDRFAEVTRLLGPKTRRTDPSLGPSSSSTPISSNSFRPRWSLPQSLGNPRKPTPGHPNISRP